jgi:hypothetical protein
VSATTWLVEADFEQQRCRTGRDGGTTCRHYHELLRGYSWWSGDATTNHGCSLFAHALKSVNTEREPLILRCAPCLQAFGCGDVRPKLERFDVPIASLLPHSEPTYAAHDTDPAPPIRTFGHPTLRAVDRPSLGHRGR